MTAGHFASVESCIKNKEKLSKEVIKMWQFILGVFVGANISLFLYAIILAGARSEKNNE